MCRGRNRQEMRLAIQVILAHRGGETGRRPAFEPRPARAKPAVAPPGTPDSRSPTVLPGHGPQWTRPAPPIPGPNRPAPARPEADRPAPPIPFPTPSCPGTARSGPARHLRFPFPRRPAQARPAVDPQAPRFPFPHRPAQARPVADPPGTSDSLSPAVRPPHGQRRTRPAPPIPDPALVRPGHAPRRTRLVPPISDRPSVPPSHRLPEGAVLS